MKTRRVMLPSVTGFPVEPKRPAHESVSRLVAHRHFCIPYAPFGDPDTRIDAECIEVATEEAFSLEIMPDWVRVYYGRWEPYNEGRQAERDATCARIRDEVKEAMA